MTDSVEYLYAADYRHADKVARRIGWRPHGRSGWIKPDGYEVLFICFAEQLAVVGKEATIYFLDEMSPEMQRFKRRWEKLRA